MSFKHSLTKDHLNKKTLCVDISPRQRHWKNEKFLCFHQKYSERRKYSKQCNISRVDWELFFCCESQRLNLNIFFLSKQFLMCSFYFQFNLGIFFFNWYFFTEGKWIFMANRFVVRIFYFLWNVREVSVTGCWTI